VSLDDGYETPEQAAIGDTPERFVTVLGVRVDGDSATVWLLANDRARFEPYTEYCTRSDGRWYPDVGEGGISLDAPWEVRERAYDIEAGEA
jgi:hypothetical protein